MRQGNSNKRMRGRGGNGNSGGGPGRKGPNPLTRSYESAGPDVKIRGTAHHIAEKYVALARDAQSSGDRVLAENYLQHAEHYYRLIAAAQAQLQQPIQIIRSDIQAEDDEDDDLDTAVDVRANYVPTEAPQPYIEDSAMERLPVERPVPQPSARYERTDRGERMERSDRPERQDGRFQDRRFGRDRNNDARPRQDFGGDRFRSEPRGEARPSDEAEAGAPVSDRGGERDFRNRDRRFEPRQGRGNDRYEPRPPRGEGRAETRGDEGDLPPRRVNVEEALSTDALPAFITATRRPTPVAAPAPVVEAPAPEEAPAVAVAEAPEAAEAVDAGEAAPKRRARGTRGRGRKAETADVAAVAEADASDDA